MKNKKKDRSIKGVVKRFAPEKMTFYYITIIYGIISGAAAVIPYYLIWKTVTGSRSPKGGTGPSKPSTPGRGANGDGSRSAAAAVSSGAVLAIRRLKQARGQSHHRTFRIIIMSHIPDMPCSNPYICRKR